jgi:hypothetical protein
MIKSGCHAGILSGLSGVCSRGFKTLDMCIIVAQVVMH